VLGRRGGQGKSRVGPEGGKEGRGLVASWASQEEKGGMGLFPFLSYFLYLLFFFISFSSLYLKLGLVLIQIQPCSTILDRCTSKQNILQK
jgi:hypothetical protein